MSNLNDKIQEIYDSTPEYVHSVCLGNKIKNGIEIDEEAIVYFVYKKLPIEEIPENEKIPSTVNIDGKTYKTDVIENSGFSAMLCYADNDPKVTFLRSRQRPLSGGLEITNFFTWKETRPNYFNYKFGTLGLIAIDNQDDTLVGLTNAHVGIVDAFNCSERYINQEIINIRDDKKYVSEFGITGFNQTVHPSIMQWGKSDSKNMDSDKIGQPKRYYPFSSTNPNYIDAALITIRQGFVDSNSSSQAEIANTYAMPFATTAEIDSLGVGGSKYGAIIMSCGRTTGPKNGTCPMIVKYINVNATINNYYLQGNEIAIPFSDCLKFQYVDSSTAPISAGDSGSALLADFNGTNKIIGLVFASNTTSTPNFGFACRIDRIANSLNISAWDGTTPSYTSYPPEIDSILRPADDGREYIDYDGKRYWQAGLISTSDQITDI
jgi:hypothetical protein